MTPQYARTARADSPFYGACTAATAGVPENFVAQFTLTVNTTAPDAIYSGAKP